MADESSERSNISRTVVRRRPQDAPPTARIEREPATDAGTENEKTQPEAAIPLVQAPGLPEVPGYVVTREIARGGMGVVYAAHDPVFGREVAVKVMHARQEPGRFLIEAKVTAQLPHPGVPPVYALGELADGRPFLAMKMIQGRTLANELKSSRRADLPRLLGAFERICETVGFAHDRGIIHRDLKPSNVMVGRFGEVLVMDWGLAKQVGGGQRSASVEEIQRIAALQREAIETTYGAVKGTPAYMAPEQARGEVVDARADVFALGGILAAILTGNPPFVGDTARETVRKAALAELDECFEELDECGADPELIATAKKCLAPLPADRYADGQEVAAVVAEYRAGVEERLREAELECAAAEARAAEGRKRKRLQLAAVALVVASAGAGIASWQWYERRAERGAADRRENEARLTGVAEAEARARAEQAERGIDAGLKLAADLRKQYKFAEADAALAQALELASGGAPERVAEVERARADLALVVKLDDIRFRKWVFVNEPNGKGDFDLKGAPAEYRRALESRGLHPEAATPSELAKRIATSGAKAELVAALDDWAVNESDRATRERLLEIARKADPHPWRDRLRDPAVWRDAGAVAKLAADADPATATPASLSALAMVMRTRGLDPVPLLSTARAKHPTDFELAFVLGQLLSLAGAPASGPYEAARALRPNNLSVWNNLGIVLQVGGDLPGAVAALKEAVRLDPKYAKAHHNLGYALRASGDPAGAAAAYREAIRLDPTFVPAYVNLGSLMAVRGPTDEVVEMFREAIRRDPKCAAAHTNLGSALHARGDRAGAIKAYRESIRLDPTDARVFNNLGVNLQITGDLPGAVAAYRAAVRIDPKHTKAHFNLGDALLLAKDADGAIASFREVVRLDPKDVPALVNLGNLVAQKNELDEAIALFRAALRVDAKCALAYHGLGKALIQKRDGPGALAVLREGVRANAKDAESRTLLAALLADNGDLKGALVLLREVVQLRPKDPVARNDLGSILAENKELEAAIEEFRESVRLDSKYVVGYCNLSRALMQKRDFEGAISVCREAITLDPKCAPAHVNLGSVYMQQMKYADAIDCARTAISHAPKDDGAHAMLGIALQKTGDIAGARAALTEAAKLDKRWAAALAKLPSEVAPAPREVKGP